MKSIRVFTLAALMLNCIIFLGWKKPMRDPNEFATFTLDGVQRNFAAPEDTLYSTLNGAQHYITAFLIDIGEPRNFGLQVSCSGTGTFQVEGFEVGYDATVYPLYGTMNVNITEYGPAGTGYIAGNGSGYVADIWDPATPIPVSYSFRVKRDQ